MPTREASTGRVRHRRTLTAFLLGLALILGFSSVLLYREHQRSVAVLLERSLTALSISWSAVQTQYRYSVSTYFQEYARDRHTLELLRMARDPAQADQARQELLEHLGPVYQRLLGYGIRQFHFHTPDGDSFLRFHHPSRYGDNLSSIRPSIAMVNSELRPVFGFEVGRVVSGYRSVFPIIDLDGQHLGSVELSMPFSVLMHELQNLMPGSSFQLLLAADKQRAILFEEQQSLFEAWPPSDAFLIEDPRGLRADAPPPLPGDIERLTHYLGQRPDLIAQMLEGQQRGFAVDLDGHFYAVLQTPVIDPVGEPVGILVSYLHEPELASLARALWLRLALTWAALLGLAAAVYVALRTLDAKLTERKRLSVISHSLGQGLYLTDSQGLIVTINAHACSVLGYAEEEAMGRSAHQLFHSHSDNEFKTEQDCPIVSTVRAGHEYRADNQFQRSNGELLEVSVVSRPILMNGRFAGAVTVFDDISERKAAERALAVSRQRLSDILWGTGVGTWEWNVRTGETRFNERWAEMVGYRLEELQPTSIAVWERFAHPDDLALSAQALQRHFNGETEHYEIEMRMRHRSGEWIWVLDRGRVLTRGADGAPEWMAGTHLEITRRKLAEERALEARLLLEAALENSPSGIIVAAASDSCIRFVNRAAQRFQLNGIDGEDGGRGESLDLFARRWRTRRPDGELLNADQWPLARALRGEAVPGEEAILVGPDGIEHWINMSASPIRAADGRVSAAIVVFSDITVQKKALLQFHHGAHYDALTGLPNRVLLADRLEQAMQRSLRSGLKLALVFIDLDEFKPVNDQYGHAVGDLLLIELARRMSAVLRAVDTLARLGGDEFVAVLADLDKLDTVEMVASRLLTVLAAPVIIDQLSLKVTASIGVAMFPQEGVIDQVELLRQADQAMYRAKLSGRNRWQFFDAGTDTKPADPKPS